MFKKILTLFISAVLLLVSSPLFAEESASSTSEVTQVQGDTASSVLKETVTSVSTSTLTKKVTAVKKSTPVKTIAKSTKKAPADLSKVSCEIPKTVVLKKGVSDGSSFAVTKLQTALVKGGYLSATPNGYFGAATYAAVRKMQSENDLLVTGIVGPYSLAKANELLCGQISAKTTDKTMVKTETAKDTTISSGDTSADTSAKPLISLFSIKTNTDGVQTYDALVKNADTISIKADCPSSVAEVSALVGLTKQKIADSDSVCKKDKYVFVSDQTSGDLFERKDALLTFVDRDAMSSWFAIDATSSAYVSVPYTVKACKQNICVQKKLSFEVRDFFQKAVSSQLSIDSFLVNSGTNTFSLKASNFNHLTIKPGCPYNVQPVTQAGVAVPDDATPCNVEKDIVPDSTTLTASYEKTAETLSQYGFYFVLKPVNGAYSDYETVEFTAKACTGVQAESVSSTTLRCVEKKSYLTVNQKSLPQASSTTK